MENKPHVPNAQFVQKLTYNLQEAARALGVSDPTMQSLARRPGFPGFRVGKRWLIPCDLLKEWVEEQATQSNNVAG